ncbi:MAG: error-prone DNA polymerase [Gammaproteobacteria bacterium]|nr:error-prone DNA polymerase [Gammaproteobacteria bacterium]
MSRPLPDYAELHCASNFSFLNGASHPEELVARAGDLGYQGLALTDEASVAGVVRAHGAARGHGIRLMVGSALCLEDGPRLVLLAPDRAAYGRLCALISRGRRAAAKGSYRLVREDLADGVPGCLALLPGGTLGLPEPRDARWLREVFGERAWLAVTLLRGPRDGVLLEELEGLGRAAAMPLVATGDVLMHGRGRRALQDTLTAIRRGTTLATAGHALQPNGERHLRRRHELACIYPPALLAETLAVAERCTFSLDELRYEYPDELVPAGTSPAAHLRRLTEAGMARRWPQGVPPRVRAMVDHELALIADLGYEPYFLTVHDIVGFARGRGILCQGRGSAANSAVCYCLGITAVDPARMEMLFERFVSKERDEPPDIDVDFEHERREEVIQYIYGKYGRERAALAAAVITYRPRSAVRDVGKALGLDAGEVDRLARSHCWWDGREMQGERLQELGLDPGSPVMRRLLYLVNTLVGFPRHLSQHVGGFVISRGPLAELVPVENAAMAERTVIQWDKDDLEALGLLKVDVLALGMLTAIRRAFDLVAGYSGRRLALATVPAEDPAVYAMVQRADTVGVFQIESRAQMAMLPRLRPRTFYDLVIEVAIVRPGPIQGGMVHPYLRRRQGKEPVTYPSPAVKSVLERTLGVPIFQEQVMKLAVVAAGFTPGEADQLRRAMAAWRRKGGLEAFEARLVAGMGRNGYPEAFARQIFNQIKGFGEYGFPESHAASFALLVYVSAWLKHHEPAAFTAALLNSQPMGFYGPSQLVQDARRHGVEVRDVDVRYSEWDCSLENKVLDFGHSSFKKGAGAAPTADKGQRTNDQNQPALRLGLRMVKGLSRESAERLMAARRDGGFADVRELAARAGIRRRDLDALARAGALRGLDGERHRAYWAVLGTEPTLPLLGQPAFREAPPALAPATEGEDMVADYAALGLTLGRHPLALVRERLAAMGVGSAGQVNGRRHGSRVRAAGLVVNRQRPSTASGVTFVTLEDESGHINLVVWQRLAEAQRPVLLGARLLGVDGVVERDGEVVHLVAERLKDLSHLVADLAAASRDFR